mmetsp:Transcript_14334/g.22230  ORF Transcript_14334/g.22230 Transcript_14334/m.22230 type:complete len:148 (+) Transcript_14334:24-467(+)
MATLNVKILEADLQCIESQLPHTFPTSCERQVVDAHFFVSLRIVQSSGSKQCSTFVKEKTCRPVWEEEFNLNIEEENAELELVVYDSDFDRRGHRCLAFQGLPGQVSRAHIIVGVRLCQTWVVHANYYQNVGPEHAYTLAGCSVEAK